MQKRFLSIHILLIQLRPEVYIYKSIHCLHTLNINSELSKASQEFTQGKKFNRQDLYRQYTS